MRFRHCEKTFLGRRSNLFDHPFIPAFTNASYLSSNLKTPAQGGEPVHKAFLFEAVMLSVAEVSFLPSLFYNTNQSNNTPHTID